ncbi:MAG: hypothetical protein MMC33_010073 [Icmadophila ericetorum]|nr:hypothetical protein [Icmadophila ericetorum]
MPPERTSARMPPKNRSALRPIAGNEVHKRVAPKEKGGDKKGIFTAGRIGGGAGEGQNQNQDEEENDNEDEDSMYDEDLDDVDKA